VVKALVGVVEPAKLPHALSHPTLYLHSWVHLPDEVRVLMCGDFVLFIVSALDLQIARYNGPLEDIAEEFVERFGGQAKKRIKRRGRHKPDDLLRELHSAESAQSFTARHGLVTRQAARSTRPEQKEDKSLDRGLVICGAAMELEGVREAFEHAHKRLPTELQTLFVDQGRALIVSDCQPNANSSWAELAADHDVFCWCDRDCDHLA
jgi:hypothetical protein